MFLSPDTYDMSNWFSYAGGGKKKDQNNTEKLSE